MQIKQEIKRKKYPLGERRESWKPMEERRDEGRL